MNYITLLRENLSADSIGRSKKTGNIVVRKGFFYRHGMDSQKYAARVAEQLKNLNIADKLTIVDSGEVWKAFSGGASVANQSHWWVELTEGMVIPAPTVAESFDHN